VFVAELADAVDPRVDVGEPIAHRGGAVAAAGGGIIVPA
jgi:hypothetical protein